MMMAHEETFRERGEYQEQQRQKVEEEAQQAGGAAAFYQWGARWQGSIEDIFGFIKAL